MEGFSCNIYACSWTLWHSLKFVIVHVDVTTVWSLLEIVWILHIVLTKILTCLPLILITGTILSITIPALYSRYEERVDRCCGIIHRKLSHHYKIVDESVISRIPQSLSKDKDSWVWCTYRLSLSLLYSSEVQTLPKLNDFGYTIMFLELVLLSIMHMIF